ncbi:hypothetical protein CRG98_018780 [Punica granatum]|uniref:PGG domain-containing protein n=1 Tax=Punica granatum TaxID=22663 RepID=A0A2I0JWW8_PUNGR|nr:hypothetical protein CRG98_018780 [Punica granatum]
MVRSSHGLLVTTWHLLLLLLWLSKVEYKKPFPPCLSFHTPSLFFLCNSPATTPSASPSSSRQETLPPLGSATDVANPEPSRRCYFWSPLCKSLVTALLLLVAAAELLVTTAFLQGTVAELSIVATPMLVVATSMLVTTTFLQVTTTFLLVTATFLQVIAMPSLVIATVGVHVAAALSRNSPGPRDLKSHLRV